MPTVFLIPASDGADGVQVFPERPHVEPITIGDTFRIDDVDYEVVGVDYDELERLISLKPIP